MAIREGRTTKEVVIYILKQVGGKGEKAGQVHGECLAKEAGDISESLENSPGHSSGLLSIRVCPSESKIGLENGFLGTLRKEHL